MPRGIPKALTDHPESAMCWCGKVFQKKHPDQIHCCKWHRSLASYYRRNLRAIPPPASPPSRKRQPPPEGPDGV